MQWAAPRVRPPPLRPRNGFYVRQAFQQQGRQALTLIHELHFSWGVVVALDAVKKINQGEFGGWSLFSLVGAVIVFKKHEVVRLSEHMLLLFTACWRRSNSLRLRILNRQQLQPAALLRLGFSNVVFRLKVTHIPLWYRQLPFKL